MLDNVASGRYYDRLHMLELLFSQINRHFFHILHMDYHESVQQYYYCRDNETIH